MTYVSDLLKKTPKSRIVNVSSIVNACGKVNYDMLNGENYGVATAYYNTKLLNILFTKELARRLEGTGLFLFLLVCSVRMACSFKKLSELS